MITLPKSILNAIVQQAKAELPNEACGLLAGKDNQIVKNYALTNVDASPEHFSFDPSEQFKTLRAARSEGLQILANYHSHPETPARPSQEDIRLAFDPNIVYIIVSLAQTEPVAKAFHIRNGVVEPVEIEVLD